jgi:plastocyanin
MRRKLYSSAFFLLMGVLCCASVSYATDQAAEETKAENRIVAVSARAGLNPSTLQLAPGTTIIWVNHSSQPAEIHFLEKKVTLACGAPVNFFIGEDGAYESAKIPFGGTASLCFVEKGKFEYVYRASATFYPLSEKEHKGIIWIK